MPVVSCCAGHASMDGLHVHCQTQGRDGASWLAVPVGRPDPRRLQMGRAHGNMARGRCQPEAPGAGRPARPASLLTLVRSCLLKREGRRHGPRVCRTFETRMPLSAAAGGTGGGRVCARARALCSSGAASRASRAGRRGVCWRKAAGPRPHSLSLARESSADSEDSYTYPHGKFVAQLRN